MIMPMKVCCYFFVRCTLCSCCCFSSFLHDFRVKVVCCKKCCILSGSRAKKWLSFCSAGALKGLKDILASNLKYNRYRVRVFGIQRVKRKLCFTVSRFFAVRFCSRFAVDVSAGLTQPEEISRKAY